MNFSSFDEMQKAVDIVGNSRHPTNKIAATIFGTDSARAQYSISKTNFWPESIAKTVGRNVKIGNSSGTVHAETACIMAAPYTDGASICVTDPFCPNCAKNMAEAGIRNIYIDHKGFAKDFAERRGDQFTAMSMRVCEKAGINVYEIHRKDKMLVPILEIPETYHPYDENPVEIEPVPEADEGIFREFVAMKLQDYKGRKLAIAFARDKNRKPFGMCALAHPVVGYSSEQDGADIDQPEGKYSFMQEPVNRLLMCAPRHGLKPVNGLLFYTQLPTSREQVNIVGAGLGSLIVKNMQKARDDWAYEAMKKLSKHEVLTFYGL